MKNLKQKKPGTVLWAVDPFEEECRPSASGAREMSRWAKKAGLEILPVHVVSPSARERADGLVPGPEDAHATVVRYLREFGIRGLASPCVLFDESYSREGAIRKLLQLAEERDAAWIVVSSHGRSGIERLMLGSFAESLLRESERPVIFLPSGVRPTGSGRKAETALFATDFSPRSQDAFSAFLAEAKRENFDLVIFHALVYPAPVMDGMLAMGSTLPENYFAEQESWARKQGGKWVELAAAQGVKARFIVRSAGVLASVGAEILDLAARERASLVAMASLSGPLARFVVGSAPYEVFRAQKCAVWIYGPKAACMENSPLKSGEKKTKRQLAGALGSVT
jgi:nucleotide-binding universal stress UspA family protein